MNLRAFFEPYDPIASVDPAQPGLFRWRSGYPLPDDALPVSLAEGDTPLVSGEALAARLGIARLDIKDESRNPTWSYKDRLAAVAVTKARSDGAEGVVVATTGNHGAAVAAYAARAGLRCLILTSAAASPTMLAQMRGYGADVVALPTSEDRWTLMNQVVSEDGWFPVSGFQTPPVGSTPFGIDGYKSIAFELFLQLRGVPDAVVVPTAYGDGLAGIQRGFEELVRSGNVRRQPRMIAVEPLGPHAAALERGGDIVPVLDRRPTVAFSIGNPVGTYQALRAIRDSGGTSVAGFEDDEILAAQRLLATTSGILAETASSIALAGVARLRENGGIGAEESVVIVSTSSGLKTLQESRLIGTTPLIEPDIAALHVWLREQHPTD